VQRQAGKQRGASSQAAAGTDGRTDRQTSSPASVAVRPDAKAIREVHLREHGVVRRAALPAQRAQRDRRARVPNVDRQRHLVATCRAIDVAVGLGRQGPTNRMQLVPFGMESRTLGPYLGLRGARGRALPGG
jgi:hypothetical protein